MMSNRKLSAICAISLFLCVSLVGTALGSTPPSKGVALVIGNIKYPGADLRNATADAESVSLALQDLGFSVTLEQNIGLKEFKAAITLFQKAVNASPGIAIVYFSGHGIQNDEGENFLVPVDAHIAKPADVAGAAVSVQSIFDAIGARASPSIIILDACRVNPFANAPRDWRVGLSQPSNPPPNSLIAFATSPGSVALDGSGVHSPYTRALLRHIYKPGQSVLDLFTSVTADVQANTDGSQVPWQNTSIAAGVYLRDPVFISAHFLSVDDDALIMVNGNVAYDYNQDGAGPKPIMLREETNDVIIKVYNQRSFTGGIPGLGGHLPEGWNYNLELKRADESGIVPLSGREDVPSDNGPHHGKLFTVATLQLTVDERSGFVELGKIDPAVWAH